MDVAIPIEDGDFCELLFEHKEKLPDICYLKIMDMLKTHHSGVKNENDIYNELVDNIDKVEPDVMKLIMKKFQYMLKSQIVVVHTIKNSNWRVYTLLSIACLFFILHNVNICLNKP
jgi:hypothetical protein